MLEKNNNRLDLYLYLTFEANHEDWEVVTLSNYF